jgi:hypothetical protein
MLEVKCTKKINYKLLYKYIYNIMNSLDNIKPLVKEEPIIWKYPTIPVPPFRLIVVAPSSSGKKYNDI